jgi:Tfp pilus assembly protein PilF
MLGVARFSVLTRGLAACLALAFAGPALAQGGAQTVQEAVQLYRNGNTQGAISALEQIVAQKPEDVDALGWLGFLYLRMDKPEDAIPPLERALAKQPNSIEVLNNLGSSYLATSQYDKALPHFQRVSQLQPDRFEAWYNIGTIHLKKREWTPALEAYSRAARLKPDDAFTQNNLAAVYEGQKNFDRAATHYAKASDLRKDNAAFARNAGFAFLQAGKASSAAPFFERAYALDPSDLKVVIALANHYIRVGRATEGLKLYQAIEASAGDRPEYWYNYGVLKASTGDKAGAEAAYRRALDSSPNDLDALNNLGLLLLEKGENEEAKVVFDKLAGLNSKSTEAKLNLAAACARTNDLDRAIELWKEVIRAEPGRQSVRLSLADALWKAGDYGGARYHYNQLCLMNPANADAHNGLGLWHLSQNEPTKAEAEFRLAIKHRPNFAHAYNNLGVALDKLNRRPQAIQALQKALQIDPDFEEAKKNLERLKGSE